MLRFVCPTNGFGRTHELADLAAIELGRPDSDWLAEVVAQYEALGGETSLPFEEVDLYPSGMPPGDVAFAIITYQDLDDALSGVEASWAVYA